MNIGDLIVQIGAIGNSKEVKTFGEAVKKAGKAIDDFDKKQSKTETGAKGLSNIFSKMPMKLLGIASAIATAYYALDRMTESLAKQNQQWLLLANQSDIAMSTLQRWDTIGKIAGIEGVGQQIQSLEQKIFNLKLTGQGASGFQMGGIMPTNANDVMNQLRRRVSGMSNSSATFLLQQMGLDPKMLTLLRMTREEWDEFIKATNQYTLTEKQRREIEKMNRELQTAKLKISYFKDVIVKALMPVVLKLTQDFAFITGKIAKFIEWLDKGDSVGAKVTKTLLGIAGAIGAIRIAMIALSAHPIIATITIVLGLLIQLWQFIEHIADDINHFKNGGGSLLGVIVKGLQDLNLKGYIDFETPDWINKLIEIIHAFKGGNGGIKLPNTGIPAIDISGQIGAWIGNKLAQNMFGNTKNVNMPITIYSSNPIQDINSQYIYALQ